MKIDSNTPIQLVTISDRRVILTFPDGYAGKVLFNDASEYLKKAMESQGIYSLEKHEFVKLDDPGFGRAFYEIYFPQKMAPSGEYKWELI